MSLIKRLTLMAFLGVTLIGSSGCMGLIYQLGIAQGIAQYDKEALEKELFDQQKWIHAYDGDVSTNRCVRGAMFRDLEKKYLKESMVKIEIFTLLGEPDYYNDYFFRQKKYRCFDYNLGRCGIDGPGDLLLFCPTERNKFKHILTNDYDKRLSNTCTPKDELLRKCP